jgi:hypothetical protein
MSDNDTGTIKWHVDAALSTRTWKVTLEPLWLLALVLSAPSLWNRKSTLKVQLKQNW